MVRLPVALGMVGILLVSPLLGYLFAEEPEAGMVLKKNRWIFPSAPAQMKTQLPDVGLVERYWPVDHHTKSESRAAESEMATGRYTWMLVAVIRQGSNFSALVMRPDKKLVSLSVGMFLDGDRKITHIETDQLTWVNRKGDRGVLSLYPQATVSQAITTKP